MALSKREQEVQKFLKAKHAAKHGITPTKVAKKTPKKKAAKKKAK